MAKLKIILILVLLIFSNFVYSNINQEKTDKFKLINKGKKIF